MVALDQPGEKKKQGHDSASPPENHHGQGTSHAAVVPHCLLRGPSLRGAKDVSAAQGNGGGQQEHAQGGQQLFFEMPPGLQKGSCKTASSKRMLTSKEANLASSRNTAHSHGYPEPPRFKETPSEFYAAPATSMEPPSDGEKARARTVRRLYHIVKFLFWPFRGVRKNCSTWTLFDP